MRYRRCLRLLLGEILRGAVFGIESDLIFESLIEKLSSLKNEKNTEEVKNQITGIVMLLFAVADELKIDLEDALMNRIEGLNQNG
jgi:hypothetical protein